MKPNLLFIITDQQRYDAVGYNNKLVKTPNIDQLASQSLVCHQAIVQSPQCQPSRASLLTGIYPDNLCMWWNETKLNLNNITIGNILRDNGYNTGYFGKLHIDSELNHKQTCKHFGFDHSFLTEDWMNLLSKLSKTDPGGIRSVRREFFSIMSKNHDPDMSDYLAPWTGKLSSAKYHHEEIITNHAADFIKRQNGKPFACFVSFRGPHPPYAAPPPYNDMYKLGELPLPDRIIPNDYGHMLSSRYWHHIKSQYYGAIAWIDYYIGQLLELIEDDTIVVFTSDHGDILGDHGLFSKGIYTYDGNIRVPLVIKNKRYSHLDYQHPVQLIDLLPTLLSMMNIEINHCLDGIDLSNCFIDNRSAQDYTFSAIGAEQRMYMIRSNNYKYVHDLNNEQFYDLINDPLEQHNNINNEQYSDLILRLKIALSQHLSNLKQYNAGVHPDIRNTRNQAININYFM